MSASLLQPAVIAAIDDLEVVARYIVEGLRTGEHRSPFHGFSAEFSQYRPYRPGDDLKYLDWKVLARTNRLYTRQFRETTNLSAMLVVDASASMAFPGEGGVSKFAYARLMAAALAYLLVQQGDAVGLMTMADGRFVYVPPRGGRMHLRRVLARLSTLTPSGTWTPGIVISRAAELLRRRGVLLMLSDFYDAEAETLRELKRAVTRGHEAAVLQVLSRPEIDFSFTGGIEFEDLETGATRLVETSAMADAYRSKVGDFLTKWRTESGRGGLDYALMTTDVPPDDALRAYLIRRGAGRDLAPMTVRSS